MFSYIRSSLFKYIKKLISKQNMPLIEPAEEPRTDFYDFSKPTFTLDYWVSSSRTFYTLDVNANKFVPISKKIHIFELSLCKPIAAKLSDINHPYIISTPLNFYIFNKENQVYVPYRNKLKISLDIQ